MLPDAGAQSKTGIENYNMLRPGNGYTWMPVVHHRGKRGFYTEMRYNYEAPKTASVYIGRSFSKEGKLSYDIVPMAGVVFGEYRGASLAVNAGVEYHRFYFASQSQYTINKNDRYENFFFNWSEIGYQPVRWLYAGISAQFTKAFHSYLATEYGFMAGVVMGKITIPVYVFNPLNERKNYIIGIIAEW